MTARERLDEVLMRLADTKVAHTWDTLVHQHTLRVGRLVITSDKRETAAQMAAFQFGRDHQRGLDRRSVQPLTEALRRKGA